MISPAFDALVCDLDGVIYRGEEVISGAPEAIHRLRERGVRVLFCTNNADSTVDGYVKRLRGLDIGAESGDVLTSATVTAEVLESRGFSGKTAIVVGGDGIREELSNVCISIKDDPAVSVADLVVVALDTGFTYESMKRASIAVRRGATLIATNSDTSFPAADALWPGAGAILASIETASGRKAEVMGKPNDPMMSIAARRLQGAEDIAIIGDRADTDLAGGVVRGWPTILVLSGVTTQEQANHLEPKPDLIIGSIAELE